MAANRGRALRRSMRLIKAQHPIDPAKLWDPGVDLRGLSSEPGETVRLYICYLATFALVIVPGGPLFEEMGWRGFALPRMERLHGQFSHRSSWTASSGGGIIGIELFTLTAVTFTIVKTWVFDNTQASVCCRLYWCTTRSTPPEGRGREILASRRAGSCMDRRPEAIRGAPLSASDLEAPNTICRGVA